MGHFHYARHFAVLAAAAIVLFLPGRWDFFGEAFLPTFAISGALHALALVFALRATHALLRKCAFVLAAAALSVLTLYIGILSLELFAGLPAGVRLYLALGLCSASGAITYGSLIRLFWLPEFSSRSILAIASGCVLGTLVAFLARGYFPFLAGWWLAAAWWFAFSAGLWYFDTHPRGGGLAA
ncbi:MAG TPA: hypothetical protein VNY80_02240 [Steroidobacteraceae bacterium]|jgi:hypothetical protein|nr:hypothetical protein [Steroidobacteraceae bacterium]